MNAESIIADGIAAQIPPDTQKLAARMAQDAFAHMFRLTLGGDEKELAETAVKLEEQCYNWSRAGQDKDAQSLRIALLISGMDQWGLAYTQAFGLTAIPALTALLGSLRSRLNAQEDSLLQNHFHAITHNEADAIDFKIDLRRGIHLALWNAMVACEKQEEAEAVLKALGAMLLALVRDMPQLGWRLVADALASIQISLLGATALSALAQESTQQLFESLRQAMAADTYKAISAQANQAIFAWQQARRSAH